MVQVCKYKIGLLEYRLVINEYWVQNQLGVLCCEWCNYYELDYEFSNRI